MHEYSKENKDSCLICRQMAKEEEETDRQFKDDELYHYAEEIKTPREKRTTNRKKKRSSLSSRSSRSSRSRSSLSSRSRSSLSSRSRSSSSGRNSQKNGKKQKLNEGRSDASLKRMKDVKARMGTQWQVY